MMIAASLFLIFSARAVILLLSDIKFCWIWKLLYIKMPNTAWCEWSLWFPRCKIFKLQTSHLVHISYFFPSTSLFCLPLLIISLSSLDASVCLSLQWYVLISHLLSPSLMCPPLILTRLLCVNISASPSVSEAKATSRYISRVVSVYILSIFNVFPPPTTWLFSHTKKSSQLSLLENGEKTAP